MAASKRRRGGPRLLTIRTSAELQQLNSHTVVSEYRGLIFQGKTLVNHLGAVSQTARDLLREAVDQGREFKFVMAMSLSKVSASDGALDDIKQYGVSLVDGDTEKVRRIMLQGALHGKRLLTKISHEAKGAKAGHVQIS